MTEVLIGCYTPRRGEGKGVALARLTDGVVSAVDAVLPAESPSFLAWHPSLPVVYAVAETETEEGAISAWSLDGNRPLGTVSSGGADPCHLTVDATGRYLVTVNYTGGSVAMHRLGDDGAPLERTDLVQHTRLGSHPRADHPHPHMVYADGERLIITDLGGDCVYHYRLDQGRLARERVIDAPAGSGPRHLLRVGPLWMVTAEISGEVLVYDEGWELVGAVPAASAPGMLSELAADDRYLYVANRGPDSIGVLRLTGGLPELVAEVPSGAWPRHIAVRDGYLYVSAQLADEVVTMRLDPETGVPTRIGSLATGAPTCVLLGRS